MASLQDMMVAALLQRQGKVGSPTEVNALNQGPGNQALLIPDLPPEFQMQSMLGGGNGPLSPNAQINNQNAINAFINSARSSPLGR